MSQPHLLLTDYQGQPIAGWLMCEKFDGFRAIWNGHDFISREGFVYPVPDWFKMGLPFESLDGELYMGKGTLSKLASVTQKTGSDWNGVEFVVFDSPHCQKFARRLKRILDLDLPHHCRVAPYRRCASTDDFITYGREIVAKGGEGAVVRNPRGVYKSGRSADALRIKSGVCLP